MAAILLSSMFPDGVGLPPKIIRYAAEMHSALNRANGDIDLWCAGMGLILSRKRLKHGARAMLLEHTLFGQMCILQKNMSRTEEIASIAHELCHDKLHVDCVAYRSLKNREITKDEAQAEMFASLVLFPSLREYETMDVFRKTCGAPPMIAEARIKFFEKYGL